MGAFLFFSRTGNPPRDVDGGRRNYPLPSEQVEPLEDDYAQQHEAVFGTDEPKSKIGQKMPSTGGTGAQADWGMDDVITKRSPDQSETSRSTRPMPSKTKNSDWALEDFEGKKAVDQQFEFSTPSNQPVTAPESDWSIDDVKPKSKTQGDDWSIE